MGGMDIRTHRTKLAVLTVGAGVGLALLAAGLADRSPPAPPASPRAARPAPAALDRGSPPRPALAGRRPSEPLPEPEQDPEPEDGADLRSVALVIDVVDEEGRPAEGAMVVPVDCPGFEGGAPGEYLVEPGPCVLRAVRRDGALIARGSAASVDVWGPDPTYLQLELQSRQTGGIGIRFVPSELGMRVMDVTPGTPAARAGIEAGDLVVAVGDEDAIGKDGDWFVDRMTGAVGTEVEFTLGIESDTGLSQRTVRVVRAFLEI